MQARTQPQIDPHLAACPVFAGLAPEALVRLSAAAGRHRYDRGQVVFRQGEPGDCMYVLTRGSVAISIQSSDGGVAVLALLDPPAPFGELAVVDGGPRVAVATAREPTELLRIARATVLHLVASEPAVGGALIASLVAMVRRVDEQNSDLALRDLPHRVRKHLLGAALRQHGSPPVVPGAALPVDLRINQTELATQVGGSRQQVNRILAGLESAGAIERQGHRIVRVRPHLLAVDE
jgi:CRP/FNR family cyclic AMP-dependent transcriptional regulator